MPNIKKVEIAAKTIHGLQVRTKNVDEMNPDTHKIAPLWGKFFSEIMPKLEPSPPPLIGGYSNYESDGSGEYELRVGAEGLDVQEDLVDVKIEAGKYLVFSVKGELSSEVIKVWGQVWAYFEDPSIDERRAYKTDFERYTAKDEAEIYIGVTYL
jgi:predicted transcriptional regulator YdeE